MRKESRNVLIDTSAWVEFFRGSSGTADAVAGLIEAGQASICGVICYELLQGAKSDHEAAQLSNVLSALHYIEMDPDVWIRAGNLSARLRKKGITLPMSDLLIGALALEHNLDVLTIDDHFSSIPGLKRYQE
ncbi:MAG: PIN domain-containing protein [Nitrospirota bacterium]